MTLFSAGLADGVLMPFFALWARQTGGVPTAYIGFLRACNAGTLLSIAALGFLGVGLLPPQPERGAMISEALSYMADQPMMLAGPPIAIFLATWSATLVGEAYAARNEPA